MNRGNRLQRYQRFEFPTYNRGKDDKLYFYPEPTVRGECKDGVTIHITGKYGGWIIDFNDLVKMVELAKQARDTSNEPEAIGL